MPKMLTPKCSSILIIERHFSKQGHTTARRGVRYLVVRRGYVHIRYRRVGACVSYIFMGYNLQTQIKGGFGRESGFLQFTAFFSQIVGWGGRGVGCHVGHAHGCHVIWRLDSSLPHPFLLT